MTIEQFQSETFRVAHAIFDHFQANPLSSMPRVARDWRELQSFVRSAASELMLSQDAAAGIERMTLHPEFLLAATTLTKEADLEATKAAMIAAYENGDWSNSYFLPCAPFASYILELCEMVEPASPPRAQQVDDANEIPL